MVSQICCCLGDDRRKYPGVHGSGTDLRQGTQPVRRIVEISKRSALINCLNSDWTQCCLHLCSVLPCSETAQWLAPCLKDFVFVTYINYSIPERSRCFRLATVIAAIVALQALSAIHVFIRKCSCQPRISYCLQSPRDLGTMDLVSGSCARRLRYECSPVVLFQQEVCTCAVCS